jgi:hypothetical protein
LLLLLINVTPAFPGVIVSPITIADPGVGELPTGEESKVVTVAAANLEAVVGVPRRTPGPGVPLRISCLSADFGVAFLAVGVPFLRGVETGLRLSKISGLNYGKPNESD